MKLRRLSVRIRLILALCALPSLAWTACAAPRDANLHGADPHGADPHGADPHGADPHGAAGGGSGSTGTANTPQAPPQARPTKWHEVMEDVVGPAYEIVMLGEAKRLPEQMDLAKIARAAREAAEVMQLGYGRLERKDVPGFADMARGSEQWLRQIAADADAGHAGRVRTAIVDGETQHCIACHDAVERQRR